MDRRTFLAKTTAAAGSLAVTSTALADVHTSRLDVERHRFGVNYTPSHNWWFCWNDWNADPIRRDLDAIAALGADHMRVLLIWPYFQPNPKYVSVPHLERLDQLLSLMGERRLDALVTVFTGQLSGWYFLPPFQTARGAHAGEAFYSDGAMWAAQELFVRSLARVMRPHGNVIGFDLGNELNTCWSAPSAAGNHWMRRMFGLTRSVLPNALHVNGVDQEPWFTGTTFSQRALVAEQRMPVMHCYPYWAGALKYGGAMDDASVKLPAAMAALIRSYAGTQQKPVWAGEFNTCIEALTERQQAEWLERAVAAAIDEGVSWFTYWDSHDVDRRFAFNSLEYSLGLLTNDGRMKEQGRAFQRLAAAHRGRAVVLPKVALRPPPTEQTTEAAWRWMLEWMR